MQLKVKLGGGGKPCEDDTAGKAGGAYRFPALSWLTQEVLWHIWVLTVKLIDIFRYSLINWNIALHLLSFKILQFISGFTRPEKGKISPFPGSLQEESSLFFILINHSTLEIIRLWQLDYSVIVRPVPDWEKDEGVVTWWRNFACRFLHSLWET